MIMIWAVQYDYNKECPISCNDTWSMVVLQDCMDLLQIEPGMDVLKAEPDLCNEMCLTSSHGGNKVTDIKVEEVTDVTDEEDEEPMTFPVMKAETEVTCLSVC